MRKLRLHLAEVMELSAHWLRYGYVAHEPTVELIPKPGRIIQDEFGVIYLLEKCQGCNQDYRGERLSSKSNIEIIDGKEVSVERLKTDVLRQFLAQGYQLAE